MRFVRIARFYVIYSETVSRYSDILSEICHYYETNTLYVHMPYFQWSFKVDIIIKTIFDEVLQTDVFRRLHQEHNIEISPHIRRILQKYHLWHRQGLNY